MSLDWRAIAAGLDDQGWAVAAGVLNGDQCHRLAALFDRPDLFRNSVQMEKFGFGRGLYRYFAYPLPEMVADLRRDCYPPLAAIANRWQERLNTAERFPASHGEFLRRCHADGQSRPTPLLLRYGTGDYNCLHQDLYGRHVFPLQMAILLSRPGEDFRGGELVLSEQRPRRQSRPMVVPLERGDAVFFAVNQRPVTGSRGDTRVTLRHGVSELRQGRRFTLGIIFHDAA